MYIPSSVQLVLLSVLSCLSTGIAHDEIPESDVERIGTNVLHKLLPYMNRIEENLKRDLTSLINQKIASLNESVSDNLMEYIDQIGSDLTDHLCNKMDMYLVSVNASMEEKLQAVLSRLEEHEQQTAYEIARLQSNITSQLLTFDSLLISVNASMWRNFQVVLSQLEEHKQQTASEIAGLWSNMASRLMTFDSLLVSVNASVGGKFKAVESQLEEHKQQIESKIAGVQSNMTSRLMTFDSLNSNTQQLTKLCNKMDALSSDLVSVNASMGEELRAVERQLEEYKSKITSDSFQSNTNSEQLTNRVDTLSMKLVSINDSMNRISYSVKTHDDNMTSELMEVDQRLQQNYALQLIHKHGNLIGPPCRGTGIWRPVVYLDMKDPNTNCPSGWQLSSYSKRTCTRASTEWYTCDSVIFPVIGVNYTRVCGRIIGYQYWNTNAFLATTTSIDNSYVVGVSLTHGSPRQHIWTFAAGYSENTDTDTNIVCPCDASINIAIPPFVGGDYFCESGWNSGGFTQFFPDDPLWDGEGCTTSSRCCSFNNPPYFTKELPRSTNDGIEVRLCHHTPFDDAPIELIELYVQ